MYKTSGKVCVNERLELEIEIRGGLKSTYLAMDSLSEELEINLSLFSP